MGKDDNRIEEARAALAPHGLFLRGIVHFDGDGPALDEERSAKTILLVGNIGGSMWPAFARWREQSPAPVDDPMDRWSDEVIRPIADKFGGRAYFPSEKPWQPFQQWAMRAEGLKASPLGILIHPIYGLWHGYRGAIGFADRLGTKTQPFADHPCDHCPDKPCLSTCPVDAVHALRFDVASCRDHLGTSTGTGGCRSSGCVARNACPVGADYRYGPEQLRFHMAAFR